MCAELNGYLNPFHSPVLVRRQTHALYTFYYLCMPCVHNPQAPVKSAHQGRRASSPGQEAASASATQAAPQQTPTRPAPIPPTQTYTYSPAPVAHAQSAPEQAHAFTNGASTATQENSLQVTAMAPPPLAGVNVMKVVMVGAECAPWSKTGVQACQTSDRLGIF